MKITMEMPEVKKCQAIECAYNTDNRCHALAITVGGLNDHRCDTMFNCHAFMQRKDPAGVGACKVMNCVNNENCECQAGSIEVSFANGYADCVMFSDK